MLTLEPVTFLAGIPPFQLLDRETLTSLAKASLLEYYPQGFPILTQGGPASDSLQIVLTGCAKVSLRSSESEEIVVDERTEGDAIGFPSLYTRDRSRTDVTAIRDTTCLLIPREPFLRMLEAHPDVREYFHRTFLAKYMDKAITDMRTRSRVFAGGEKLLFTMSVGDLITRPVAAAPRQTPIGAAAALMSRHGVSSLVLTDEGDVPVGMMTDRDLREKVAARGRDFAEPAGDNMSTTLIKADAADFCFEPLLTMLRYNIHHLLIVDHGRLKGIVTYHHLLLLQGTSPISVVREIEGQTDLEGLVSAAGKITGIVELLVKEGAKAGNIKRIITEINVSRLTGSDGNWMSAGYDPFALLRLGNSTYVANRSKTGNAAVWDISNPASPQLLATLPGTGDVSDLYEETVDDSVAPGRYRVDGEWRPVRTRVESYRGPGGAVLAVDTVRYSHRGPMHRSGGRWFSRRWTVLEPSAETDVFLHLARARDAVEWLKYMEEYQAPTQNGLVADRNGTIAIRSSGWYPLRPGDGRGDRVFDGSASARAATGWNKWFGNDIFYKM